MLVLSTQETEMMLGLLWAVHTASIAVMAATAYEAHAVSRRRSMAMEGRYHQSMMMRMCDSAGRGSGGCAGGFQEAAPRELQEEAVAQQALQGGF